LVVAKKGAVDAATPGQALVLRLAEGDVHRSDGAGEGYTLIGFDRAEIAVGVEQSIWRKNRFRSPKEELTPSELWQAGVEAKANGSDPRPFWMQFHVRLGQALSPLAFALLGVPLALARRGLVRGRGYAVALVGYVAYYVLYRALENLGSQGKLPLLLAGQLPNLLFAALGAAWLGRLGRPGVAR
jgi:lipopolysaccharide export system permease protein